MNTETIIQQSLTRDEETLLRSVLFLETKIELIVDRIN